MKKKLLALCLLAGVLAGCAGSPGDTPGTGDGAGTGKYTVISAQKAKQMMDQADSFVLVDVRTEAEYRAQRIPGAILIPDTQIVAQAPSQLPDKSALIFVYCRSGVRAKASATSLATLGYSNVYDMGGILNWPYDTVSG